VRKVQLMNNNKKEKVITLSVKMFCFFLKLFDLKEFVNFKKFCLKEKFSFEKVINELM